MKAEIEALTVNVPAKAGDSGKLFGSVTNTDVMNAIKAAGGPLVEKRNVQISAPIKKTGSHTVAIDLHPDVVARVTIEVVPS